MNQTFHTLIYAAPRLEVDELIQVRRMLEKFLGKDFVVMSDTEASCINKEILDNINLKVPEEGEKINKLLQIAKERNISYVPSPAASMALNSYIDRKGIPNPLD
jgi:tRNA isopentenyl-2-thiomethyl-A-37 hydroxylase MiaE